MNISDLIKQSSDKSYVVSELELIQVQWLIIDDEPTWHGGGQNGLSHQPRLEEILVELACQNLVGREVNVGVWAGRLEETHGLKCVWSCRRLALSCHSLPGLTLPGLTGGRAEPLGFVSFTAGPEVELDVGFAVAWCSEPEITVGAFEGFGASVKAHVDL